MTLSIYLSDNIADILRCYGTINDVVNKILIAGAEGAIDIMDKPRIPDRKGGHYYQIKIEEPNYIDLLSIYSAKSSKISLRRLLYWFVENEVYEELGWEPVDTYVEEKVSKTYDIIMKLKQSVYKASKLLPQYENEFNTIKELLNKIEEELWYV